MNHQLSSSQSIDINASPAKVWEVLTDPKLIAEYLYGTETITNWKVGRAIIFQGEYQGHQYKDKGLVVENKPNEVLSYTYWSGFSGLEDKPENHSLITYSLKQKENNTTEFTWSQKGFPDEDRQKHSQDGLKDMLVQIKGIAER